jgi:NMD protein affecting ribosome stability and mRNA decay
MIVKIWRFKVDCYNCGEKIDVVWPQDHDMNLFGYYLKDQEYCHVKRVFSNSLGREVWGNICPSCGQYQGNTFIRIAWLNIIMSGAVTLDDRIIESPNISPACTECGKITEDLKLIYSDQSVCPECFQNKIPQDEREAVLSYEAGTQQKNLKSKSRKGQ